MSSYPLAPVTPHGLRMLREESRDDMFRWALTLGHILETPGAPSLDYLEYVETTEGDALRRDFTTWRTLIDATSDRNQLERPYAHGHTNDCSQTGCWLS